MTATPALLRAIADLRDTLTPAQIQAKSEALNAKIGARIAALSDPAATLAALDAEIAADTAALATANAALVIADAREATQAGWVAELQATITSLQEQIVIGIPPAVQLDIAERDEVHALLNDLGIPIP